MICTDVAARGIDVSGLPFGKNSLPKSSKLSVFIPSKSIKI
jgi:hypothetical protein